LKGLVLLTPIHFAGAIFDCDGTLADTMPLHYEAWRQCLKNHSVDFSEELFYELGGVPSPEIVRILNRRFGCSLEPEATADEKEELYVHLLPHAQPIPCVVQLVHEYAGHIPLAVASGGFRRIIERTLDGLGLRSYFQVIATAEDVVHGKPAPDVFLLAAEQLGVDPGQCVAYEDSPLGLEAAHRAGMTGIDVRSLIESCLADSTV
jgi:beta-phosphoglucomutase family hydrolase